MSKKQQVSMHDVHVTEKVDEKAVRSFEAGDSEEKNDRTEEDSTAPLEVLEGSAKDDEKKLDHEAFERENKEKRIKQQRLEQLTPKHPSRHSEFAPKQNIGLARYPTNNIRARVAAAYDGRWTKKYIKALRIKHLPCSASEFFQLQRSTDGRQDNEHNKYRGWAPPLRTILVGTRSHKEIKKSASPEFSCPLSLLGGYETALVPRIFSYIRSPYDHVRFTIPAALVGVGAPRSTGHLLRFVKGRTRPECYKRIMERRDPLTSSIAGSATPPTAASTTKDKVIPSQSKEDISVDKNGAIGDAYVSFAKDFYPLVNACPWVREEQGNVAYLTVQETAHVEEGETQRRPGLHIESPGVFADSSFLPCSEHPWGMGNFRARCPPNNFDHYEGGIYIASNVDHSTVLFDALVDRSVPGMVDRHGGCEYLRPIFPETKATKLKAGELVWMTDSTVHEAGPQLQAGPRTFFRLVMPSVSHWYAAHSTPNPKVSLPDGVVVIEDCKFAAAVGKN